MVRKSSKQPYVLLASTGITATRLNCTRAKRLLLVEPDFSTTTEDQAYSRIRRHGQINAETCTYRLWCSGVKVEHAIVKRQALRAEFKKLTFEAKQAVDNLPAEGESWDESQYA